VQRLVRFGFNLEQRAGELRENIMDIYHETGTKLKSSILGKESSKKKQEPQKCSWTEDDGIWQSSCGVYFEFNDGGIEQNNFNYCYNCGKKISA